MNKDVQHIAPVLNVLPVRIYYEDTDAGGIVYYGSYLRFAERGRTELLRSFGEENIALLEREQLAFVVRVCQIDYLSPARLDDALEVHTRVTHVGGASMKMSQTVLRDGRVITEIRVTVVCMHTSGPLIGKPSRIPGEIRAALQSSCEPSCENLQNNS